MPGADSLCGFETTKECGSFSVQEFASNSNYAFVLLFYLTVLYFIHYKKHFCSPICSFVCLLLPDQILLSSSFNAYGSWNIRHQIRAVPISAE